MKSRTVLVLLAALLAGRNVGAQAVQNVVLRNSFAPLGAGARGLGMGGAFIAVADDGSAASFNPAGLTQLRRSELALVGFWSHLRTTQSIPVSPDTGQAETKIETTSHAAPDFVGLAVPFQVSSRSLTVQLSYQRTVDLFGKGTARFLVGQAPLSGFLEEDDIRRLKLAPSTPVNLLVDVFPEQSGAFHTLSLAVAHEVTSRLSLGASVNYWLAEWRAAGQEVSRFVIDVRPGERPIDFLRRESLFGQEQSLRGLNVNLGFMLKYPRITIGGVARLPFAGDYHLAETIDSEDFVLGRSVDTQTDSFPVTSRLRWPRSLGIGLAVRPLRGLTLAGDYTRSQWSRAMIEDLPDGALFTPRKEAFTSSGETVVVDDLTDRNFFDLLPASQSSTLDTDQWRAGAEYLLTAIPKVVVPFRAGFFRDRSPITEINGQGRAIKGWTLGTGLNFSHFVLDLAFEHRASEGAVGVRFSEGEDDEPIPIGFASTETVRQKRFVASLIYRFGDDDPVKRALRYLFVGSKEKEDN